jgi:hypothetical protein
MDRFAIFDTNLCLVGPDTLLAIPFRFDKHRPPTVDFLIARSAAWGLRRNMNKSPKCPFRNGEALSIVAKVLSCTLCILLSKVLSLTGKNKDSVVGI